MYMASQRDGPDEQVTGILEKNTCVYHQTNICLFRSNSQATVNVNVADLSSRSEG